MTEAPWLGGSNLRHPRGRASIGCAALQSLRGDASASSTCCYIYIYRVYIYRLWLRRLGGCLTALENTRLKRTVRSARLSRMSQPITPPPTREQRTPSSSSNPPSEAEDGHDLKLHIGGEQVKQGWKILNAQPKPGADFVGNICDLSQFADASVSAIYASHVLEHVPQALVPATLAGIHRVLKKGGAFMVSVPDLEVLCSLFTHPGGTMDNRFHIMRMMFGGQTDAFDFHYFGWSWEFMQQSPPTHNTLLFSRSVPHPPPPLTHTTSCSAKLSTNPSLHQVLECCRL